MKRCLIVFAKEPRIGMVKTRLNTRMSKRKILGLYRAFLKDTAILASSVQCSLRVLAHDSPEEPSYLKRVFAGFDFHKQGSGDLGSRMARAFVSVAKRGASRVVLIGSDSPNMPARRIIEAFSKLRSNDIVIGPCPDGGYYLIGMNRPCRDIFKGIRWSSPQVLDATIKKAKSLKMRVAELSPWYDVDDEQGVSRLIADLRSKHNGAARSTRKFLNAA